VKRKWNKRAGTDSSTRRRGRAGRREGGENAVAVRPVGRAALSFSVSKVDLFSEVIWECFLNAYCRYMGIIASHNDYLCIWEGYKYLDEEKKRRKEEVIFGCQSA